MPCSVVETPYFRTPHSRSCSGLGCVPPVLRNLLQVRHTHATPVCGNKRPLIPLTLAGFGQEAGALEQKTAQRANRLCAYSESVHEKSSIHLGSKCSNRANYFYSSPRGASELPLLQPRRREPGTVAQESCGASAMSSNSME